MTKYIGLVLLLLSIHNSSHGLQCLDVLGTKFEADVYTELKSLRDGVHLRTMSKNLTPAARKSFEEMIPKLAELSTRFEETQSDIFKKYSPSFLPRLREAMTKMGQEFRRQNQVIANELSRYLLDNGNLRLSDLEMWKEYRDVKSSQALDFIKDPSTVYFGLGHFVDTHALKRTEEWLMTKVEESVSPGYRWAREPFEISLSSNFRITTVVERESSEIYPASRLVAPEVLGADNLRVSGLPLTVEVLSFFKRFGDESGHLRVGSGHRPPKRTVTEQLFLRDRARVLNTVQSRWSEGNSLYPPVLSEKGVEFHGFSNAVEYRFHNRVLRVPTRLARRGTEEESRAYEQRKKKMRWPFRFSRESDKEIYVLEDNIAYAEFVILPTHQEFVTALIELIHTEQ
ncbi:MAG: hypothetical protein ACRBBP_03470 [Bdellovibrionales bacterium]